MADSAKVLSVDALKQFRIALITFMEEGRNALSGVDMELRRMREWLERDQLSYWQTQVKRRHEAMMTARTELYRRQLAQQGSDAVSDTEQKEALREAQRRLRMAEEKVEAVKRLVPIFHHALSEYTSRATPLADHLSGGIERSLASLQKMVESLESYLALQAPSAPSLQSEGSASESSMSTARAGSPAEHATGTGSDSEAPAEAAKPEDSPAAAAATAIVEQGNAS